MPLIEMAAIVTLLVAVGVLAFWRDDRARRAILVLSIVALAAAAWAAWQLRWQVAGLLVLAPVIGAGGYWLAGKRPAVRRIAAGLFGVLTLGAVLPYLMFPIFDLPVPDGQYRVGVRSIDMQDDARHGVMYSAPDAPRRFPVTIWYPAPANATGPVRPYFTRQEALDEGVSTATLWGLPSWMLLSLHSVGVHGIADAPVAGGDRFPVVIFSHGYFSHRAQNTALMERLASHGYIVVSVAHVRDSADVRMRDGTLIPVAMHEGPGGVGNPALDKAWEDATAAFMGGKTQAERIAALPAYNAAVAPQRLGASLRAWRADVLFAARTLRATPPASVADIFARADFARTVYAGMSFGGSTSPSACDADPNCVAAVDLDGENFDAAQFDREIRAPLLLIVTDSPFTDSQRIDTHANPTDYAWEKWQCVGDRADIVRLRARGMFHRGLTDLVLSARGDFKRETYTRLDGPRALSMINDTVLAFLETHVRHGPPARFAAELKRYPEFERLDTRSLRSYAAGLPGRALCGVKTAS